ncbi:hypothetical protein [Actinoplanes missouriensis]|nr:hypothetical protein [Actinoplanes missouriensis]
MSQGYIKCSCDRYEPGTDGICLDRECGHDAHQHVADVGPHEQCLAQEGDEAGCYLPFEDAEPSAKDATP